MDGIIIINKEKDFTSFDVVAKMRGICKQKKIGHTGTLDPDATGVLPVCLGCATKLCDMLMDTNKVYRATLMLGITTDTQDTSGTILAEKEVLCSEANVREAITSFIGPGMQVPPMYSALKVNGKKLCDLAREGIEVERKAREITISSIEIEAVNLPEVVMKVTCSKGTYIRTLCHDIGLKLGCGGAMKELVRLETSGFTYDSAHTLREVEEIRDAGRLKEILIPVDYVFHALPAALVKEAYIKNADNGNYLLHEWMKFEREDCGIEKIRVYDEQKSCFYGIYEYNEVKQAYKPVKLFFYHF
ncbi:MAG: tRNA pseudouridine(55) synthase TruB [Lachnospiraceae bacterium]|nr:tRNA pseudouridine(55) synthase TruB [Lachnospiraceae bacterium]